jgi:hypothetical protein
VADEAHELAAAHAEAEVLEDGEARVTLGQLFDD